VAVDAVIHKPHPVTDADLKRDPSQHYVEEIEVLKNGVKKVVRHNGNYHGHVSMSACLMSPDGVPGKKAEMLDQIHCQRSKIPNPAERERPRWAELANEALQAAGSADRIDHRSYAARGIERLPTAHRGPAATAIKRRGQAGRISQADQAAQAAAQAARDVAAEAQAAVDDALAELAEAEAGLAADLLGMEAEAAAAAAGVGSGSAGTAAAEGPDLAIGPAPQAAPVAPAGSVLGAGRRPAPGAVPPVRRRPAPGAQAAPAPAPVPVRQVAPVQVDAGERRSQAEARTAALRAEMQRRKAAAALSQAQEAPQGEPGAPGGSRGPQSGPGHLLPASGSDAPLAPPQVRGRDAGGLQPSPRAIKAAPAPAPAVPLAARLAQAKAAAQAREGELQAATRRQSTDEVAAVQRAGVVQRFEALKERISGLRAERGELAQQIAKRGVGARLAAAVHDPQGLRIDAIDAELLGLRTALKDAAPAAARAAAVPPAEVRDSQAEMKRLRETVAAAQAEVERIEREQRWQSRPQGPAELGDFDRDR
jgi:hypothetical protein